MMSDDAPRLPARIPSLDGLRAISILSVIVAHLAETNRFPLSIHGLEHLGNLGVKVFFVISGFLITTLLLKERAASGQISLTKFYRRRVIRIFPAFYAYIAAMLAAEQLGLLELPRGDLLHAVTYTMNYHHVRGWHLNHLWSLSVEEQFYLLWPAVIAFSGPKRALQAAAATVFVAPFVRLIMWRMGAPASALTREFQAVADVLATGCLLAGAHNWLGRQKRYMALLPSPLFFVVPGVLLTLSFASYFARPVVFYVIGQSVSNVAIALLIDRSVRLPSDWVGRALNQRSLVFVGALSYSLYLGQEPFLNPMSTSWSTTFPQNLVLVVVTSLISYYLVEKQGLKLRHRLAA
ncbi:MAG: acyltransferase [Thermoanaerobaculia bacterium]